jgi:Domain of unknown function (DUF5348)
LKTIRLADLEKVALALAAMGLKPAEIAGRLGLKERSVKKLLEMWKTRGEENMILLLGGIQKTVAGRYRLNDLNLSSGDCVELLVGGHWAKGTVEFWNGEYHWFSRSEGIPVVLQEGMVMRATLGRWNDI